MATVVAVFATACAVTLIAGVALAYTGSELANRAGINGVVFGATILAGVTALPEVSSGIAAIRLGDFELAMGDIFGGNAFQVCLFLLADLVAGRPVLPSQGNANSWIGEQGLILTAVYGAEIIVLPRRRHARLGPDSSAVLVLYAVGVVGPSWCVSEHHVTPQAHPPRPRRPPGPPRDRPRLAASHRYPHRRNRSPTSRQAARPRVSSA